MRAGDAILVALAAPLGVALGCGLGVSGEGSSGGPSSSGGNSGSDTSMGAGDDVVASSGGGSGEFDATLGGSSGGGHLDGAAPRDARTADAPQNADGGLKADSGDGGGPCARLTVCCQALGTISPTSTASCLQAAQDGGATGCSYEILALTSIGIFCP